MVDKTYSKEKKYDFQEEREKIDRMYAQLSLRADILYHFVTTYSSYIHQPRDYGVEKSSTW